MYWIAVSADEYELPIIVADSSTELAEKLGTTPTSIRVRAHEQKSVAKSGISIFKVEELKEGEYNE